MQPFWELLVLHRVGGKWVIDRFCFVSDELSLIYITVKEK